MTGSRRAESSASDRDLRSSAHRDLLWMAVQGDDREAFDSLINHFTPVLIRYAHHMVEPIYCEDLVQETWLRAWKCRHTYCGEAHPFTWLHTVMSSVAASDRKLRASDNDSAATDDLACAGDTAEFEAFLVADSVDEALAQLDPGEAIVIRRRYLAEQSWATIAHEMNLASTGHARKIYALAIQKLVRRQAERSATAQHTAFSQGETTMES